MKKVKFNKFLFFIGLSIILFPFILRIISSVEQTTVVNNYKKEISIMSNEQKNEIQENAIEYNQNLYASNEFDNSLSQDNISLFDFSKQNVLAYITIPKINLELPIYDGCSDSVLSLGVGHLPNTSLPIGGKNTHSVLVGHTGLANSIIFDNLDKLNIGDTFFITYLDNILNYEICQINVVDPNDTGSLIIQKNEDLVTLVTCTPKFINTHRLLITGKRIVLNNYTDDTINCDTKDNFTEDTINYNTKDNNTESIQAEDNYNNYFICLLLINILILMNFFGLIIFLIYKIKKRNCKFK